MIALGLFLAGLFSNQPPLPSSAFRFRDPEIFETSALESVLQERSIDPDVRITASQIALESLDMQSRPTRQARPMPGLGAAVLKTAIASASRRFGISEDYLVRLALKESNLDRFAKSPTSTAAGAFQFTENTWLCSLRSFRSDLNVQLPWILALPSGRCIVPSRQDRRRLLALRFDAYLSAGVAALLSRQHANELQKRFGRAPTHSELYALHFFGQAQGLAYLRAVYRTPHLPGERMFPAAAMANRSIFYDRNGRPFTLEGVAYRLSL